ncbi:hypothetical protein [Undibacterium curvum]|uniref:hypothetical protein n=2 Tax=Undibacterium curvum TaxID=2762294 RepID=UPI003D114C1B
MRPQSESQIGAEEKLYVKSRAWTRQARCLQDFVYTFWADAYELYAKNHRLFASSSHNFAAAGVIICAVREQNFSEKKGISSTERYAKRESKGKLKRIRFHARHLLASVDGQNLVVFFMTRHKQAGDDRATQNGADDH